MLYIQEPSEAEMGMGSLELELDSGETLLCRLWGLTDPWVLYNCSKCFEATKASVQPVNLDGRCLLSVCVFMGRHVHGVRGQLYRISSQLALMWV